VTTLPRLRGRVVTDSLFFSGEGGPPLHAGSIESQSFSLFIECWLFTNIRAWVNLPSHQPQANLRNSLYRSVVNSALEDAELDASVVAGEHGSIRPSARRLPRMQFVSSLHHPRRILDFRSWILYLLRTSPLPDFLHAQLMADHIFQRVIFYQFLRRLSWAVNQQSQPISGS